MYAVALVLAQLDCEHLSLVGWWVQVNKNWLIKGRIGSECASASLCARTWNRIRLVAALSASYRWGAVCQVVLSAAWPLSHDATCLSWPPAFSSSMTDPALPVSQTTTAT
jgi:hypothetical protein